MADQTLTGAITRLRADGYTVDLVATTDGYLACAQCHAVEDPARMQVNHTVRFEGDSDPGDEAILLGVSCECGALGPYSAAYGPATPPADSAVLNRFAARRRNDQC